jgi:GGDEF domain-containing protein
MIAEHAQSASILELMELVPAIFQRVEAVELMNAASRAGYTRYVRGFVNNGTISSIISVPEDDCEERLKHNLETAVLIRTRSGLVSNLTIFSIDAPELHDGSTNPSEADIEGQAVFHQLSALFAIALRERIGRLTLLPNTAMFEAAATAAENAFRSEGRDFSLVLVDFYYIKLINQTHSYAAGDMVLAAVADTLRNSLAASGYKGSVIFRPGKTKFLHEIRKEAEAAANPHLKHDEFALLLPIILDRAVAMADLLKDEIAAKPVPFELPLRGGAMVTCSFGVVHSSDSACGGGSLWHRMLDGCVQRLEVAKSSGGNTVIF